MKHKIILNFWNNNSNNGANNTKEKESIFSVLFFGVLIFRFLFKVVNLPLFFCFCFVRVVGEDERKYPFSFLSFPFPFYGFWNFFSLLLFSISVLSFYSLILFSFSFSRDKRNVITKVLVDRRGFVNVLLILVIQSLLFLLSLLLILSFILPQRFLFSFIVFLFSLFLLFCHF